MKHGTLKHRAPQGAQMEKKPELGSCVWRKRNRSQWLDETILLMLISLKVRFIDKLRAENRELRRGFGNWSLPSSAGVKHRRKWGYPGCDCHFFPASTSKQRPLKWLNRTVAPLGLAVCGSHHPLGIWPLLNITQLCRRHPRGRSVSMNGRFPMRKWAAPREQLRFKKASSGTVRPREVSWPIAPSPFHIAAPAAIFLLTLTMKSNPGQPLTKGYSYLKLKSRYFLGKLVISFLIQGIAFPILRGGEAP